MGINFAAPLHQTGGSDIIFATMNQSLKHVTIYTDGGCDPNPSPGSYGVLLLYGGRRKELSGGFRLTTNLPDLRMALRY